MSYTLGLGVALGFITGSIVLGIYMMRRRKEYMVRLFNAHLDETPKYTDDTPLTSSTYLPPQAYAPAYFTSTLSPRIDANQFTQANITTTITPCSVVNSPSTYMPGTPR